MLKYILFISFVFSQLTANAQESYEYQPFIKEGKVWNVTYFTHEGRVSHLKTFIIKGDTIIEGKQYKKFFLDNNYVYSLREDEKKVYAIACKDKYGNPNTEEKLWYNFDVSKGDIIDMGESYMHVIEIDTIFINGMKRKLFHMYETSKDYPEAQSKGVWIEGVGCSMGPMWTHLWYYDRGNADNLNDCHEDGQCIFNYADFKDYTTEVGVPIVHRSQLPTQTVDLQGRRLTETPQRGLYIRDGKKYVVK